MANLDEEPTADNDLRGWLITIDDSTFGKTRLGFQTLEQARPAYEAMKPAIVLGETATLTLEERDENGNWVILDECDLR